MVRWVNGGVVARWVYGGEMGVVVRWCVMVWRLDGMVW